MTQELGYVICSTKEGKARGLAKCVGNEKGVYIFLDIEDANTHLEGMGDLQPYFKVFPATVEIGG